MIEDRTQPWRRKVLKVKVRTVEDAPALKLAVTPNPEIKVEIVKEGKDGK